MSHGVEILDTTQIKLPPLHYSPHPVKLSFLDCAWLVLPPVEMLFLYSRPLADLPFPSLLQALKSSLTSTLLDFLPLSGKLTYVQTTGDIEIDLSDPSVTFVEAESGLNLRRLATSEIHDVESFARLVPEIDVTVFPFRALSVQVTRFDCGGLAVGCSLHHAVADGKVGHGFVRAWASACQAKLSGVELLPSECHRQSYDRTRIRHPRGDDISREFIQFLIPNPPNTGVPSLTTTLERRLAFSRQTFVLDAHSIRSLKGQALRGATITESQPPSTFIVIAAYTWTCYVRSRSLDPNLETLLVSVMDCRTRLNPPLDDNYLGNGVCPIYTTVSVSELTSEDGLGFVRACNAIGKSIINTLKDPLSGCEYWLAEFSSFPLGRTFHVTASPRFRFYDTDFGWGRPARFEATASKGEDGEIVLVAGREEGSVQVTVVEKPERMKAFAELFLKEAITLQPRL